MLGATGAVFIKLFDIVEKARLFSNSLIVSSGNRRSLEKQAYTPLQYSACCPTSCCPSSPCYSSEAASGSPSRCWTTSGKWSRVGSPGESKEPNYRKVKIDHEFEHFLGKGPENATRLRHHPTRTHLGVGMEGFKSFNRGQSKNQGHSSGCNRRCSFKFFFIFHFHIFSSQVRPKVQCRWISQLLRQSVAPGLQPRLLVVVFIVIFSQFFLFLI